MGQATLYSNTGEPIPLFLGRTTTPFDQPAEGNSVVVSMSDTAWMAAGSVVFVVAGGYYRVDAVLTGNSVRLENILPSPPNAAPGTTIPTNALVTAGGEPGAQGASPFSLITDVSWAWPNVGEAQGLQPDTLAWMSVGQPVFVTDGVNAGTLVVDAVNSPPGFVLLLNVWGTNAGPAGGTEMSGGTISPGGALGPVGPALPSGRIAYATGNPYVTIPDPGCTVDSIHLATFTHASVSTSGSPEVLEGTDSFRVYSQQQLYNGFVNWCRVKT